MNNSALIIGTLAAATATSMCVTLALAPPIVSQPLDQRLDRSDPTLVRVLDDLRGELSTLTENQARIDTRLARLDASFAAAGMSSARVPVLDIDAAVARALSVAGAEVPPPSTWRTPDQLLAALEDSNLSGLEVQELWQRLRDEGRMDEVLAAFEARADRDPSDPEAQVALGTAYLQKIQEIGNGPLAGVLATQADRAFERALQLDPTHWEARYSKAVALTFWPPVFGKQNEAIATFESLVAQQASMVPEPHHSGPHLLLGNMYQQIGETQKAIAAWQAGLALFPGDADLAAQLALVLGG